MVVQGKVVVEGVESEEVFPQFQAKYSHAQQEGGLRWLPTKTSGGRKVAR